MTPGASGGRAGGASRTLATARFLLADAVRAQRVLLPVVAQGVVLAVLFGGDPGPPPAPWAASAFALYPVAAWLAVVLANAEDPVARTVTVTAAGSPGRAAAAVLLVALAGDLLLVALSVLWPVLVTRYAHPPPVVLTGVLAHLAAAGAGTAVGLLVARPLVTRVGWSALIASVVVVVTAVQPWLPPVGTAVRALASDGPPPVTDAVIGLALAAVAADVVAAVEKRR